MLRAPGGPDLADNIVISTTRVKGLPSSETAAVAVGPAKRSFYGFYQEFGTAFHGAQPFMRPAFDVGVTKAIADIGRAMCTALASRRISQSVTVEKGAISV